MPRNQWQTDLTLSTVCWWFWMAFRAVDRKMFLWQRTESKAIRLIHLTDSRNQSCEFNVGFSQSISMNKAFLVVVMWGDYTVRERSDICLINFNIPPRLCLIRVPFLSSFWIAGRRPKARTWMSTESTAHESSANRHLNSVNHLTPPWIHVDNGIGAHAKKTNTDLKVIIWMITWHNSLQRNGSMILFLSFRPFSHAIHAVIPDGSYEWSTC
jgi:hypothetical protein